MDDAMGEAAKQALQTGGEMLRKIAGPLAAQGTMVIDEGRLHRVELAVVARELDRRIQSAHLG